MQKRISDEFILNGLLYFNIKDIRGDAKRQDLFKMALFRKTSVLY